MAQNNLVLEEVIVTAQKREQTQQDIAATVNVVGGDVIDNFAVFDFGDIEQLTAGLSLTTVNSRNSNISLRGITTDPESGADSAVQVYFNDVSVREDVAFTQLYDLARIEVLRGPQGAVQGRTSPAGAIKMITQQPNMSLIEGYVQTSFSDNDGFNGQFASSLPIIKNELAIRLSGVYDENNGNNVENLTTGLNSTKRASSGRLSVAWEPSDSFSALLTTQYLDRSTADDPKILVGTDTLGARPTLKASDRKALGKTNDFDTLVYKLASLELNLDIAGHQLTSISGKQDSSKPGRLENDRGFYQPDLNGSFVVGDLDTFQETNTVVDSFSQEFRLASIDNDTWDYMVGAFYTKQDTTTSFESWTARSLLDGADLGDLNLLTGGSVPVNREDFAIFTFNTVRLTDKLAVDVGLRYQKVNRFNLTDVDLIRFGQIALAPAVLPFIDDVKDGTAAVFPISAISDEDSKASATATTGSFTIRYEWDEDISLYGSYSRSFRAGGISIIPDPNIEVIEEAGQLRYDDETSDAIEFGMKGRFWDGRATANVAIYFQTFDGLLSRNIGLQAQKVDGTGSFDIPGGLTYNADATMQGIELDGEVLISERWSAGGSFSYNQSEYDDGAVSPCSSQGELLTCDIGGDRIAGQPKLSFSLNSEYYIPLESMELYVRGLYKYNGDIVNSAAISGLTNAREKFDSYDTFNLFTGLRANNGKWDVSLWAKNLLDQEALISESQSDVYDTAASGGSYVSPTLIPERTIGLTARYNFSL
jgi:outer membrane receptor protein involved in Fe transport